MTGLRAERTSISERDRAAVTAGLGRTAREVSGVGHRCGCGLPDVVVTDPRLADGSPFPTVFYLTCPRAVSRVSSLESSGVMATMTADLQSDAELGEAYRRAHRDYQARREELGVVPELAGVSAGGMPDRVKCLHALVAHALAAGTGINPIGDRVLTLLGAQGLGPDRCWGAPGSCTAVQQP
ncbi:MAG: DUF501 domain-containing protein [Actinomycetes bacterium]